MAATDQISRNAVVRAGFIGSCIAESAASHGVDVTIYEPEPAPLVRSRERLAQSVGRALSRGKLTAEDAEGLIARVAYTTDFDDLGGVDAVLEAVTEDPRVKGKLFARLDERLPDARFLASNTSSIPIAELASWTQRPERVLGLHFFSPVPVMRLVEVVVGLETESAVVETAENFAAGVRMCEDGFASREDIDEGMRLGCGHPMGPLTLCDFIGLDVLYAVCDSLYEEFKRPEYAPPPLLKRMVVSGHHGRKAGRGFYEYEQSPG